MTNVWADLARMTTATSGTGTITLGAASSGYLSFAGAGITDGQVVSYGIIDGVNRETGKGTYTSAGTTLSRAVFKSTNGNAAISLSGSAEVFITGLAEDFQDMFKMAVFGVMLPSMAFKRGVVAALATGDTDLYTCPTGKRALIVAARLSGIPAAGSVTGFLEIKVSGTYYRTTSNNTVTTAQNFNFSNVGIVLEAAEILAINCATSTGATVFFDIIEFDNTAPLFTKKVLGPAAGDQTVYTVPAGKSAIITQIGGPPFSSAGVATFVADGGGNRVWKAHIVASAGSPTTANQAVPSTTTNLSTVSNINVSGGMTAADFINLNSTTNLAGLAAIFWMNIIESPNV